MAKEVNKRINVWINGKEVENNIKSVKGAMAQLTNQLNKMEIGSAEYIETSKKLKQLKEVYDEHRKSLKMTTAEVEKLASTSKDKLISAGGAAVVVGGAVAAYQKLVSSTQEYVEAFATIDDAMSGVMKTTGMTREEVELLSKSLGEIDTRTSREELLTIAQIGGRMGLAKEQILDFTKAVDLANVALGDSFSGGAEEISAVLGKISLAYKETRDANIGDSLTRIGSAINEVGASANATETNIANFVQRVGSMPEAFRPSVQEAIALGAAFEESSIDAEIASRAFGIVMTKATTNVDKFAQVMNQPVEAVQELINTNPTKFFTEFARSLQGMDATEIGNTLKGLGLNADGVIKIVGAMSGSYDRFNEILSTSNAAFEENTSLMNEFNTVNNNSAAQLEKARNAVMDAKAALGESLLPVIAQITQKSASALQMAAQLVKWGTQHKGVVIALAGALTSYVLIRTKATIAAKAHTIQLALEKAGLATATTFTNLYALAKAKLTKNTLAAANAQKALKAAFASTPWGAIIVAVTSLIAALGSLVNKTNETVDAQQSLEVEIEKQYNSEKKHIDELVKVMNSENSSREQKLNAINALKQIIPEYTAELDKEGKVINNNRKAIDDYVKSLKTKARYEGLQKEMENVENQLIEARSNQKYETKKVQDASVLSALWQDFKGLFGSKSGLAAANEELERLKAYQKDLYAEWEKVDLDIIRSTGKTYDELYSTFDENILGSMEGGESSSSGTSSGKSVKDKLADFNKQLEQFRQKQQIASLDGWNKTKQDILNSYGEMIEKAKALGQSETVKELEKERDNAIVAAGQKYLKDAEDAFSKIMTEADQLLQQSTGNGNENKILAAVAGTKQQWDEKIETVRQSRNEIQKILDDDASMEEDDPNRMAADQRAVFVTALQKSLTAEETLTKQKMQAINNTIRASITDEAGFITDKNKELERARMSDYDRQIAEIKEVYQTKIAAKRAEIAALQKLQGQDGQDDGQLQQQIDALKALIAELIALQNTEIGNVGKSSGDTWLNRLMDFDWNRLKDNWQEGLAVIAESLQDFSNVAFDVFNSIGQVAENNAQRELNEYKAAQEEKTEALQRQLDNGLISQQYYDAQVNKINEETDAKEKELELESWKREKKLSISQAIISGAVAIMQGFAQAGPIGGAVLAALQAAMTAAQVAVIASEPEPYAKGGYVNGKTFIMAGEAGREWIASNKLLEDQTTAPVISALQQYQQGNKEALAMLQPDVKRLSQTNRNISTTFATQSAKETAAADYSANMAEMLGEIRKLSGYLKDPKNRQAVISRKTQLKYEERENQLKEYARL